MSDDEIGFKAYQTVGIAFGNTKAVTNLMLDTTLYGVNSKKGEVLHDTWIGPFRVFSVLEPSGWVSTRAQDYEDPKGGTYIVDCRPDNLTVVTNLFAAVLLFEGDDRAAPSRAVQWIAANSWAEKCFCPESGHPAIWHGDTIL